MTPYRPARREFLMQALIACGAPFLPPSLGAQARLQPATVAARYLGAGGREAVQAIGEAYLKQSGIERTEEAILAAVTATLQLIGRSQTETSAVSALAQAVRRDFREQRAVQVEGWILARTEVDLCLLALLPLAG